MEHERYMREALRLAAQSAEEGEVPVGCVIVCDGEIVGRGRNRREAKKTALSHAELEAIAQACEQLGGWRLHRCTLYVTLEPCPMCAGAIINARIQTVCYGTEDEKAGCCGSKINLFQAGFNHRPEVVRGVLRDACAAQLSKFFQSLRDKRREARAGQPRVHHMKLGDDPFAKIAEGSKRIELRLNDPKRQQVRVGDTIVFTNMEQRTQTLRTRVVQLHRFASFDALFAVLPPALCGFAPDAHPTGADMERYYPAEKQRKYGALGIELAKMED